MLRRFRRDKLRKEVGNDGLQSTWRARQEKLYGEFYKLICSRKRKKKC